MDASTKIISGGGRFIYPQGDSYWTQVLADGTYEIEIDWLMRRATHRPYGMIDAGANFGYWSIVATSGSYGRHSTIAIEAGKANYEWLVLNSRTNGNCFQTLHRAVLDQSGRWVPLYGKRHAGLSLRTDWHPADSDRFEDVETITLDDAAAQYLPKRRHPVLVKLDIEGEEIKGFQGAGQLIDEGALIIYEDHGKESTHAVSRFVLTLDDMVVWCVDAHRGPTQITAIEQVARIKTVPTTGYNFFAHRRGSSWHSLFEG